MYPEKQMQSHVLKLISSMYIMALWSSPQSSYPSSATFFFLTAFTLGSAAFLALAFMRASVGKTSIEVHKLGGTEAVATCTAPDEALVLVLAPDSANKTCLLSGNADFEDESGPSAGYLSELLVDSIILRTSSHILCRGLGLSCNISLYPS